MNDVGLKHAQEILRAQPFSGLLGARLTTFGDGEATLELDIREDLLQQNGFLHGGVLSYAADNTLTFAAGTVAGPAVLTDGFSIDYLRPAKGTVLRAHGRVVRSGRSRVVCRCDLFVRSEGSDQVLCAIAQGTISVLPSTDGG